MNSEAFFTPIHELGQVLVTSTKYKPQAHPCAREIAEGLERLGIGVILDLEGQRPLASLDDLGLVISVGGDGTLLATARRLVGRSVPTLGVNIGKLGFLAEHSLEEVRAYVRGERQDGWRLSPKMMLQVTLQGGNGREQSVTCYALNDVIISQGVMTRLITTDMKVDGRHATQYRADGLVISTPVGSTAYSLSLGGPILAQGLRAFVITPIAPHSLTNRPMVLEGSSQVGLTIQSPAGELALVVDGQERFDLAAGDRISISSAPTDFLLISSGKRSYFDILRAKLGWGDTPRLRE